MDGALTIDELTFLVSYLREETLFGVDLNGNYAKGMELAVQKGFLNYDLKPNIKTLAVIEMLRMYEQADCYLHLQEYIFAFLPDDFCICNKIIEHDEKNEHLFLSGNVSLFFQVLLGHPMLLYHAKKREQKELNEPLISCSIVLEWFDQQKEFKEELSLLYKNETWYWLEDDMSFLKEYEEVNTVDWVLGRIPDTCQTSYKEVLERLVNIA